MANKSLHRLVDEDFYLGDQCDSSATRLHDRVGFFLREQFACGQHCAHVVAYYEALRNAAWAAAGSSWRRAEALSARLANTGAVARG